MSISKTEGYEGSVEDNDINGIIIRRNALGIWTCSVQIAVGDSAENRSYELDFDKKSIIDSWLSDIKTSITTALGLEVPEE